MMPNPDHDTDIFVCWTMDCEATQHAVSDVALGERAQRGYVELIAQAGLRTTLFLLPKDARTYAGWLRDHAKQGIEIGLHYHPQEEGYNDFCGAYTAAEQRAMYADAIKEFADALGFEPRVFRTGSCSANDATFPVTAELGFTSCSHSMPGRNMPRLRSNWVSAPAHVHFAHPANRLMEGGLDLVEVPVTTDPDSMLWFGGHPQDLRVELFDAKNQRYMIDKILGREKARTQHVKAVVTLTHSVFDYADNADFRRQTMVQMIADFSELAETHGIRLVPATIGEIAQTYREASRCKEEQDMSAE